MITDIVTVSKRHEHFLRLTINQSRLALFEYMDLYKINSYTNSARIGIYL